MLKRTLTGAVILLVTTLFVLLKQFSNLIFDAFILIVSYGALIEVINAHKKAEKKPYTALLLAVPLFIFIGFSAARKIFVGNYFRIVYSGIFCMILIAVIMLITFLTLDIVIAAKNRKIVSEKEEIELTEENFAFKNTKVSMKILAYPILPLSFFFILNSLPYDLSFLGIILTFAVAMMTDTFAYLFGRFFGKRKFIPEISPKKTLAGVFGGFVGGVVAATLVFIFFYFTPYFEILNITSLSLSIPAFAIIALFGAYITQLGDLIASALKRKVNLKDYANIFPGHGGFMDRFDGQMFVAVWVTLFFIFLFV